MKNILKTNDLRKHMTVQRQQIRDPKVRMLKVSRHIDTCAAAEPKFHVFPFYKMQTDCILTR